MSIVREFISLTLGSDEESAFKVIESVYEAYRTFQPDKIEGVQLPEYSVWDGTLPRLFKSLAEVKEFHKTDQENTKARGPFSFTLNPLKADILGDMAIVLCHMEAAWEPPNALSANMRITDVMRKVNGRWMMLHHHESFEPEGYAHI